MWLLRRRKVPSAARHLPQKVKGSGLALSISVGPPQCRELNFDTGVFAIGGPGHEVVRRSTLVPRRLAWGPS